ncbi:MreC: rod shape-determining protein C [Desulfobacula toluolica Tol2]|uniref:Cell shape-determining protein MreC n=2 Tax=Desulfobacula toluolica TaxID=28223 RepID=K0NJR6_DESTT|nr:MreC: rod shape-determining protein C [Desulfobacula toluolica Tol2]
MFSHKQFIFLGVALFIAMNFTVITMGSTESLPAQGLERLFISITSPIQQGVTKTIHFTRNIWNTYFMTVLAVQENVELKKQLEKTIEIKNQCKELKLENIRLKKFVDFTGLVPDTYVAAQVIARDPSPWFKTIMIDKGEKDGLVKGSPVLVSEGIVGQTIKVAHNYSRVLLITDRNSAVDALVQNSRVRGIVKGNNTVKCSFVYALRKDEVKEGEMIISSGFDQVFPKGLKIGSVLKVTKVHSQLFQDIIIETSVDFDKIEEVLVLKNIR